MAVKAFLEEMQGTIEKARNAKPEDLVSVYKGIKYPSFLCMRETFEALPSFEARQDDIMLVAYPKCGFNWMISVLQKIISIDAEAIKPDEDIPRIGLIEFIKPEKLQMLDEIRSTRLLGTHFHPNYIPKSFFDKKTKMLVVFRNPKDTAVSYYHFCQNNPVLLTYESWDAFFSEFIKGDVPWGCYFDHAVEWNKRMDDENVLIVTYEDLKENLQNGIEKISKFFNYTLTEEQIQSITEASTFKTMKEDSINTHGPFGQVIFRKGDIGDWKNLFTEEQSKEVDAKFEQYLAGTKLGAMLKYNLYCK
ncbi:sulfotransferase 6B1-like isoform X2 [Polypterus senegalus]|uniref:sulfotransferase 6B1-like isoform X2 n=1 Tax=Polypterus senegalus TaxID=55291 RepID=UPI0019634D48|nr:sulfotransferase 6B1-like isoform X2 [Polypterus senegalus]